MPRRVGRLDACGRFVYANKSGSVFFMEDGHRVRMHGNTRWTTDSQTQMRGSRPIQHSMSHRVHDTFFGDSEEDEQLALAIAISLADQEGNQDCPSYAKFIELVDCLSRGDHMV